MRAGTILKLAGAAAIAGGALRIVDAITVGVLSDHTLQLLYFMTDFLFLLGLVGIYVPRAEALGLGGLLGFVVTFLGFLIVRSSESTFFGMGYVFGAAVTLMGLTVMSIPMLLRKIGSRCAAWLWLLALALGIASAVSGAAFAARAAGVVFGAAFIFAGMELIA